MFSSTGPPPPSASGSAPLTIYTDATPSNSNFNPNNHNSTSININSTLNPLPTTVSNPFVTLHGTRSRHPNLITPINFALFRSPLKEAKLAAMKKAHELKMEAKRAALARGEDGASSSSTLGSGSTSKPFVVKESAIYFDSGPATTPTATTTTTTTTATAQSNLATSSTSILSQKRAGSPIRQEDDGGQQAKKPKKQATLHFMVARMKGKEGVSQFDAGAGKKEKGKGKGKAGKTQAQSQPVAHAPAPPPTVVTGLSGTPRVVSNSVHKDELQGLDTPARTIPHLNLTMVPSPFKVSPLKQSITETPMEVDTNVPSTPPCMSMTPPSPLTPLPTSPTKALSPLTPLPSSPTDTITRLNSPPPISLGPPRIQQPTTSGAKTGTATATATATRGRGRAITVKPGTGTGRAPPLTRSASLRQPTTAGDNEGDGDGEKTPKPGPAPRGRARAQSVRLRSPPPHPTHRPPVSHAAGPSNSSRPRAAKLVKRRSLSCPPTPGSPPLGGRDKTPNQSQMLQPQTPSAKTPLNRKSFVLTIPSSLIHKTPSRESATLGSRRTAFMYPPPIDDQATKTQSQSSLNSLNAALQKLERQPPSKEEAALVAQQKLGQMQTPKTPKGKNTGVKGIGEIGGQKGKTIFPGGVGTLFGAFTKPTTSSKAGGENKLPPMRFGTSGGGKPGFGVSGFGFRRPFEKASKKTTLETVVGSPVKGGGGQAGVQGARDESCMPLSDGFEPTDHNNNNATDGLIPIPAPSELNSTPAHRSSSPFTPIVDRSGTGKGKEKEHETGKEPVSQPLPPKDGTRRVSTAFFALAEEVNQAAFTTPDMGKPAKGRLAGGGGGGEPQSAPGPSKVAPVSGRVLRSASTAVSTPNNLPGDTPNGVGVGVHTAPGALGPGMGITSPSSIASSSSLLSNPHPSSSHPDPSRVKRSKHKSGKIPGALSVLKNCVIYVDVRTESGEDAGSLFVDMLKSLGARSVGGVRASCTHIVWKNGVLGTILKYRAMEDPKPLVVGIGWVVECVEKRARVDEATFVVDLENVGVENANKRRRSIVPRQFSSFTVISDMFNDDDESSPNKLRTDTRCFLSGKPALGPVEPLVLGAAGSGSGTSAGGNEDGHVGSDDLMQDQLEGTPASGSGTASLPPLERARRRVPSTVATVSR